MSLKNTFCPSPWFHMRIDNQGNFDYCRWTKPDHDRKVNISQVDPKTFFTENMEPIRTMFLDGGFPNRCGTCNQMEQHGKVSGRLKQLLKIGVRVENFDKTLKSSPWFETFINGKFNQLPQDWQIDLGNHCNSACLFCNPNSSSRLAQEWHKLGLIDTMPSESWTGNNELINKFTSVLKQTKSIQYLHFIGGETLITPAFKIILQILIDQNLHSTATLGLTTNLTVWPQDVVDLLKKFKSVNLGVSVESFHEVNDYVRWPSKITDVKFLLNHWLNLVRSKQWNMQIRITPTLLTVGKLLEIYDFAWEQNLSVESCNFLQEPFFLRPSVLPIDQRQKIINEMRDWLEQHHIDNQSQVVNVRNPNLAHDVIAQDLSSYIYYLENEPECDYLLPQTVKFLKQLDRNRNNCVLDYLPEYETIFKSAGY